VAGSWRALRGGNGKEIILLANQREKNRFFSSLFWVVKNSIIFLVVRAKRKKHLLVQKDA
jgi:hypothetical protein